MKKMAMLLGAVMLAGCASQPTGLRETDLRDPELLRDERYINLNFPKMQAALFKHQAACGHAPVFRMDTGHTSYATVLYKPAGTDSLEQAVMLDLVQHKANFLHDERAKALIYTYYMNAEMQERIDYVLRIFAYPELCAGDPTPERTEKTPEAVTR
jgi:hypothetical protein